MGYFENRRLRKEQEKKDKEIEKKKALERDNEREHMLEVYAKQMGDERPDGYTVVDRWWYIGGSYGLSKKGEYLYCPYCREEADQLIEKLERKRPVPENAKDLNLVDRDYVYTDIYHCFYCGNTEGIKPEPFDYNEYEGI